MQRNAAMLELAECRKIDNGHAAGTTTITPTSFKLANADGSIGYAGVCVVADLGAVTDGCVLSLKLQNGALSDGSDAADMKDSFGNVLSTGLTALGSSNGVLIVDAPGMDPTRPYITVVLARGTQNAVINTILAFLYKANKVPVAQGSTVLSSLIKPTV